MEKVMNNKQLTKAIQDLLSQQEQGRISLASLRQRQRFVLASSFVLPRLQKVHYSNLR